MRRGIDHIVVCVNRLAAARRFYESLGFITTPPALHPFGTANSLVQLQGNFIELLGIAEPDKIAPAAPGHFSFGAFNRDFLTHRQGLSMLVLQSNDARADQAEFRAKGLETYEPFEFSRLATLPDGSQVTVSFSLAFVTHQDMPEVAFFTCQQHAPEYFWKPDYQRHGNGAVAISEVIMVADEPVRFADFFALLQGEGRIATQRGALRVETGQGTLAVLSPERFAERFPDMAVEGAPDTPYFAAFQVTVADLGTAGTQLDSTGPAIRKVEGALQIAPADAFGAALEIVAAPN